MALPPAGAAYNSPIVVPDRPRRRTPAEHPNYLAGRPGLPLRGLGGKPTGLAWPARLIMDTVPAGQ